MTETHEKRSAHEIRELVSNRYGEIARSSSSCCAGGCGCGPATISPEAIGQQIGYSPEELQVVPDGSNLGLGCGNPTAIEELSPGEVVLDLGSGAGFDAFLAARQVGSTGRVIGVDMTDDMLSRARENAEREGYDNVEFRKGRIEELPVESSSVDVIISNCVVNLSPEKDKAFGEAYRVLRPGGRLAISDIVLERPLPESVRASIEAYVGCVAGASLRDEYLRGLEAAGFEAVQVVSESSYTDLWTGATPEEAAAIAAELGVAVDELKELAGAVTSVHIAARRSAFPVDRAR